MEHENSFIVDRALIETLRPLICCPGSGSVCDDNEFCSSDASSWPIINSYQTRLAYPSNPNHPSVPGTNEFCSGYMDWYIRSGCGSSEEIPDKYRGQSGNDLQKIALFCQGIQASGHQAPVSLNQNDSDWSQYVTGGGVAGGILSSVLYGFRFMKKFKEVGEEARAAGESMGVLARGLTVLNREGRALMKALEGTMDNTRDFFGKTLVKFGRLIKYIFTGAWFRKPHTAEENHVESQRPRNPEESPDADGKKKRMRQTNPFLRPVSVSTDAIVGAPDRNVVMNQIRGLLEKENKSEYKIQRRIFLKLDQKGAIYLAELAINRWHELINADPAKAQRFADTDTSPYYGKLPREYIKWFIEKYLKVSMIDELKAASDKWTRDVSVKIASQITPETKAVEAQLITDRSIGQDRNLTMYLALMAIHEWRSLRPDRQAEFITDISRPPRIGELPIDFIRPFREGIIRQSGGIEHLRQLSIVYRQISEFRPELSRYGFAVVNARASKLLSAWNDLSLKLKEVFGMRSPEGGLPYKFVELMKSSLRVGVSPRNRLTPSKNPWRFDPNTIVTYNNFNLSLIMKILADEDGDLVFYPAYLELRAKGLVDEWQQLSDNIKTAFIDEQSASGQNALNAGVPLNFIRLWMKINGSVGVTDRFAIKNNGPGNPEGGSGENSGGPSNISGYYEPRSSGPNKAGMAYMISMIDGSSAIPTLIGMQQTANNNFWSTSYQFLLGRAFPPLPVVGGRMLYAMPCMGGIR